MTTQCRPRQDSAFDCAAPHILHPEADAHETLDSLAMFSSRHLRPASCRSSRGAGRSRAADKTLSPYFFVEGGDPAIDRLPLKDTRVDVAITGVIADVTVRQVTRIAARGRFMPATSFPRRRGRPSTA